MEFRRVLFRSSLVARQVNASSCIIKHKDGLLNLNFRQVCSKLLCGEKDPLRNVIAPASLDLARAAEVGKGHRRAPTRGLCETSVPPNPPTPTCSSCLRITRFSPAGGRAPAACRSRGRGGVYPPRLPTAGRE